MTHRLARQAGFSLLELLLALAVGCTLVAVIGDAWLGELSHFGRLALQLRERAVSDRALELMRMELQEAPQVRVMPGSMEREGCGLASRTVLLHLHFTPDGASRDRDVTYSMERKPALIWRGQVLMRCGPPYGLNGQMEDSEAVSRVWLDGFSNSGLTIHQQSQVMVELILRRRFQDGAGKESDVITTMTSSVPGLKD